jgi:thiol-disulfide isomerase/thioredoxin
MDTATELQLPVEGHLPSLSGATGWLNSEPLTAESLRGRPVLVEFWTFTCINWIRTLPYVRGWYEKYRDAGLVVLGVHTPEFDVERSVESVRRAAGELGVKFPIAVDSDYAIWEAFANRYWPAMYFVDAEGRIRHHRFGEGEYEVSESVIQALLADAGAGDVGRELLGDIGQGVEASPDWDNVRSPETYVGYERSSNRVSGPDALRLNRWALTGDWTVRPQAAILDAPGGRIAYRFHARDLHLVLAPPPDGGPVRFRVLLDGEPPGDAHGVDIAENGEGTVAGPRMHQLIRQRGSVGEHTFEIEFLDAGARAYVFTFG